MSGGLVKHLANHNCQSTIGFGCLTRWSRPEVLRPWGLQGEKQRASDRPLLDGAEAKSLFELADAASRLPETAKARPKRPTTHVDARGELSRDGGSIPPASTTPRPAGHLLAEDALQHTTARAFSFTHCSPTTYADPHIPATAASRDATPPAGRPFRPHFSRNPLPFSLLSGLCGIRPGSTTLCHAATSGTAGLAVFDSRPESQTRPRPPRPHRPISLHAKA